MTKTEPMVIAGGFVSGREHAYDQNELCERCGAPRGRVMNGTVDWECVATDNVTSMFTFKARKADRKRRRQP